jgi:hypothetical protein
LVEVAEGGRRTLARLAEAAASPANAPELAQVCLARDRGMKLLAETEGIFGETAGGVTIATLKQLAEQGRIGADEVTVAFITGAGFKTVEA